MKLLSFQPFSLFRNGGGSRVLRRLYEGHEQQIVSLVVLEQSAGSVRRGNIAEVFVEALPAHRQWMRWYLRTWGAWLRDNTFRPFTNRKIKKQAAGIAFDTLHVVHHGAFSAALNTDGFSDGKALWVSFHDHFSTANTTRANTQMLWDKADRRLVISPELGQEYQKLFGAKEFEVITDGVAENEISAPHTSIPPIITVYFAGLLHIDYLPLFETLANALDELTKEGLAFSLVLRGTQEVEFLNNRAFKTEYRTDFVSDQDVKQELDSATILYLPIKFSTPDFYLYSLSTKMVSYLGGSGAILYQGPADSAACQLLRKTNAAVCCTSLDTPEMMAAIKAVLAASPEVSANAKRLAANEFSLRQIQARFWQTA